MIKKTVLLLYLLQVVFVINVQALESTDSSILIEMNSGRVIYENNSNEQKLIASITKIMTAILVIENANIRETIKVGNEVLKMYGTNIYVQPGEIITIEDLLYGLILRSGNDAAIVLANYIGGTEEKFVDMMNRKAKELGMENTKFQNSHGLDDYTENYSSAKDMAILSTYAYKNNIYKKIAGTKKYNTKTNSKSYIWYNRNKLLTQYEFCTGGKNGYTPRAGRTLVTTAEQNNMALTAVTLKINNEYEYHKQLYKEAFNRYKMYKIIDKDKFKISNTMYDSPTIKKSFYYPLTKQEKQAVNTEVILYPQKQNNIIGYINITLNKQRIGTIEIYNIPQKKEDTSIFISLKNYLFDTLKKLMLGRQNNLNPGPFVPTPLEI
ncbi:MAG: D-alanyl-D-alanine carboxypeptidase [Bacilli bacterium]|nr:D-alanyl-D-alanine carboxypeptidase [Bacilli bacterium]